MLLHDVTATSGPAATPVHTGVEAGVSDVDVVRDAVAALSWLDRDALVQRFRDRRSFTEIAERTGTTTAMVRVRIHRAAQRVEAAAGHWPVDGERPPVSDRDDAARLEDAELGVTPTLADRLDRALRGHRAPAPGPLARRVAELVEAVAARRRPLSTLAVVAAGGLVVVAGLGGAG